MDIIRELILFCIIYAVISLLFIKKDDNKEEFKDNDVIVFRFTDNIKKIMLGCSIIMFIVTIIGTVVFSKQNGSVIFTIFFGALSILTLVYYLFVRNKKVVYQNNSLRAYDMFGKEKTFNISDLELSKVILRKFERPKEHIDVREYLDYVVNSEIVNI